MLQGIIPLWKTDPSDGERGGREKSRAELIQPEKTCVLWSFQFSKLENKQVDSLRTSHAV